MKTILSKDLCQTNEAGHKPSMTDTVFQAGKLK